MRTFIAIEMLILLILICVVMPILIHKVESERRKDR